MKLSTGELQDRALEKYPFIFRNNRGAYKQEYETKSGAIRSRYITYGIPEPRRGKKESDSDMKGGDLVGLSDTGIFINIEIKGPNDIIKEGQVRWHNFILQHGGISEIWLSTGKIICCKTTAEEVNNANIQTNL